MGNRGLCDEGCLKMLKHTTESWQKGEVHSVFALANRQGGCTVSIESKQTEGEVEFVQPSRVNR